MTESNDSYTHFGYSNVPVGEKADRVGEVFHSVASRYDLMNDLMSFRLHRLWKDFAVSRSGVREGDRVLDVAGGSGDLAERFLNRVGPKGHVLLSDINPSMLAEGRRRLFDAGFVENVNYLITDAEQLAVADSSFDCVSIAFGLRNVTDKDKALRSMCRAVKPGGRVLILEFSKPVSNLLSRAYDQFSFSVIPRLGEVITKDRDSYQYLVESIRRHPDQQTLKQMMLDAGFDDVSYHNLTGGIVALHIGVRY